jgi:protein-disulfide isomerase
MKYVFFDFPLESIHKNALKAAEASRCGGEQGKYWEMHDQLFANFTALDVPQLLIYSQVIGLDSQKFQSCIESGSYEAEIRKDMVEGQKAGVRGTPTFFIGFSDQESFKVQVLKVIRGAKPYIEFKEAFDSLLLQK